MKSRTSFFNLTLYKKDITRFAPLWVLYTVGMTLIMLSSYNNSYFVGYSTSADYNFAGYARSINSMIGALSVMNWLYGILAAQLLFGELFHTRLCNALHAMPVTREARFGSHVLAGLSFSIVSNLIVGVLMMSYLSKLWFTALLWLLAMTLQYLFFFGVAVLAMHCTGNRFAAALVYTIIQFGSMVALWFAEVIFVPMMRGVVLAWESFAVFSPVVKMCMGSDYFRLFTTSGYTCFTGMGGDWSYLTAYAVVGVLMLAGSLLLYRRRALECAGDFMAFKFLRPVFLAIYTLCVGAFFAVFGTLFGNDTYVTFLIVGLFVGFFTGRMLLERTSRVFNLKSFLHLGILVVLMWLALQATQWDLFGIVRYVPNPGAVKEAEIVTFASGIGRSEAKVSDPDDLSILQQAHQLALETEGCKHDVWQKYSITYHMKDGRTVKREYTLCVSGQASAKLERLLYPPEKHLGLDGEWED